MKLKLRMLASVFFSVLLVLLSAGGALAAEEKLTADDGGLGDYFGYSVSIYGDYAIAGARYDDVEGNGNQGSAYIFHRSGVIWSEQQKLTASDGAARDYFGWSVDLTFGYDIVGAWNNDSAYVISGGAAPPVPELPTVVLLSAGLMALGSYALLRRRRARVRA